MTQDMSVNARKCLINFSTVSKRAFVWRFAGSHVLNKIIEIYLAWTHFEVILARESNRLGKYLLYPGRKIYNNFDT